MNSKSSLKKEIKNNLNDQGFFVNGKIEPLKYNKQFFKEIQQQAKKRKLKDHKNFILNNIDKIKNKTIDGCNLIPEKINLKIIEIKPGSKHEKFYKWWNFMWWSMPYQQAYGRQMRFIIWDEYHDAPFGIIGLQSPVLKMSVRDDYLSIPKEELDVWVNRSMQAQRIGALPPYNDLIGGKMVAMAVASNEIRKAYKEKYSERKTIIEKRKLNADLLFITTSSAFGKSSIYNRLNYKDEKVAISLGFTKGYGTFQFPRKLYGKISDFLESHGVNTDTSFGSGPSRKIKLLNKAFSLLDLPTFSQHNIRREYFLFPLASNLKDVIANNISPRYYDRSFNNIFRFWLERWAIPRSKRVLKWKDFNSHEYINKSIEKFFHDGE